MKLKDLLTGTDMEHCKIRIIEERPKPLHNIDMYYLYDFSKYKILLDDYNEILNPLMAIIPMQLLAYNIAKLKGCDIDKPRNLAKSVTVE